MALIHRFGLGECRTVALGRRGGGGGGADPPGSARQVRAPGFGEGGGEVEGRPPARGAASLPGSSGLGNLVGDLSLLWRAKR